jgi:hypothetical protein
MTEDKIRIKPTIKARKEINLTVWGWFLLGG